MSDRASNNKRSALKGLHSLAGVQRELAAARRLAAERAERAAAEARLRLHEQQLFARSVGPVTPVRALARVDHDLPRPQPVPLQFELDEQRALQQALSDDVDIDSLLETDDTLSFRRPEVSPDVVKKLRRGHWALQGQIDLHGLRRDAAREALGQFVHDAARRGMRCIRVVHGKGNGSPGREPILKSRVRRWLVQKQEVLAFVQARASDGGSGALMVLLMGMPAT